MVLKIDLLSAFAGDYKAHSTSLVVMKIVALILKELRNE